MKIYYKPVSGHVGPKGKYPWQEMCEIGDYFDIPEGMVAGVRPACCIRHQMTGYVYRTFTLENGTTRVMLIDIELGAQGKET